MTLTWWSRGALILAAICGLLVLDGRAWADDDDDKLKIQIQNFRCYDGPSGTFHGQFAKYIAPEPTTLNAGYSIIGRERTGGVQRTITAGTFDQAIPYIFIYQGSIMTRFRWLRTSLAGVDSVNAQTAEASEEADCERLGDRDGVQITLNVICGRTQTGLAAYARADVANHENQPAQVTGFLTLFGRPRGDDDFQELNHDHLSTVPALSVGFSNVDAPANQFRRVRAEVEAEVAGTNRTIREREDADCPG